MSLVSCRGVFPELTGERPARSGVATCQFTGSAGLVTKAAAAGTVAVTGSDPTDGRADMPAAAVSRRPDLPTAASEELPRRAPGASPIQDPPKALLRPRLPEPLSRESMASASPSPTALASSAAKLLSATAAAPQARDAPAAAEADSPVAAAATIAAAELAVPARRTSANCAATDTRTAVARGIRVGDRCTAATAATASGTAATGRTATSGGAATARNGQVADGHSPAAGCLAGLRQTSNRPSAAAPEATICEPQAARPAMATGWFPHRDSPGRCGSSDHAGGPPPVGGQDRRRPRTKRPAVNSPPRLPSGLPPSDG